MNRWAQHATAAATAVAVLALGAAGAGAATAQDHDVNAVVDATISITEPTAINPAPAPLDPTASWTTGSPSVLNLGSVKGTEQATASLTWTVTTNNTAGYSLYMSNAAASGSVLKLGTDQYPDMPAAHSDFTTVSANTNFGVAIGDAVNHAEGAAAYPGSPWGTTGAGGTQGTRYRGVPIAGMQIAGRSNAVVGDPTTVNFAATSVNLQPLQFGDYTGTVRLTASTL